MKVLGLTASCEEPRLPKLRKADWKDFQADMLKNTPPKSVVQHADCCSAYEFVGHPAVADKTKVDHSGREYVRSCVVLRWPEQNLTDHALAGTMCIDQEWRRIQEKLPDNLSVRSESDKELKLVYVRAAQWKRFHRHSERWECFCEAVKRWREAGCPDLDHLEDIGLSREEALARVRARRRAKRGVGDEESSGERAEEDEQEDHASDAVVLVPEDGMDDQELNEFFCTRPVSGGMW